MKNSDSTTQIISDEQILDFILRHLPEEEHRIFSQKVNQNAELSARVNQWDEMLFSLNQATPPIKPNSVVWDKIATQLEITPYEEENTSHHTETNNTTSLLNKLLQRFVKVGVPVAVFSVIAWFGVTTMINPSYSAAIYNQNGTMAWETDIKKNQITFKSINNVSLKSKKCVAWISSNSNVWVKLGRVPDTGKNQLKVLPIPKDYKPKVGDKIHVAMVDDRFNSEFIPLTSMSLSVATLK